jgi:hypothetical protein
VAIQDPEQRTTARRVEYRDEPRYDQHDGRRRGWPLWPLWAALGLFALACGVAGLIAANHDDHSSARKANGGQQPPAAATGGQGSLTAGGAGIVPGQTGQLRGHVGQPAQGKDLTVQSVAGQSGFSVGTSPQDRVYVEYSSAVGQNEASFVPKVGDHVNLTGPVRPAPANPAQTLKLQPQDAQLVRSQGAFVNAEHVDRVR